MDELEALEGSFSRDLGFLDSLKELENTKAAFFFCFSLKLNSFQYSVLFVFLTFFMTYYWNF